MNTIIPLANAYHDIRTDGTGVIWLVTGMATAGQASIIPLLVRTPGSCELSPIWRTPEKSTLTVYWFFAPPAILISRHQGRPPAQSLATKDSPEHLGGFLPSLEAAFRVGNKVVSDIVNHWEEYSNDVPK